VIEPRVDGSELPKKSQPESPDKIDALDALLLAWAGRKHAAVEDSAAPKKGQPIRIGQMGAPLTM